MFKKHQNIILTIAIILTVCFFLTKHFSWKNIDEKGNISVIESDGKGYYLYLPNIFINKNIASQNPDNRYILKTENGAINKYYIGTALSMFPFFSIGYFSAYLSNEPLDGYSIPFQKSINFSALFYLALGLCFFSALLLLYQIKPWIICITNILLVFGTNLMMYTVIHPSFSHIYSFCFISMFLFSSKKFLLTKNIKHATVAAFAIGFITIIRPINGIIILITPFLSGSFFEFKAIVLNQKNFKLYFTPITIFFSIISVQLFIWYIQTGSLFNWSYQHEGFYFSNPQIINVLFSFRKGFFIYTPLALLSLFGLIKLFHHSKFQFYSIASFLIILIYLTSSWWCWYYGPSFGQRSFVEYYSIFGLLLAILFNYFYKTKLGYFTISIALVFSLFNIIQSYQYVKHIISSWDMNYEKYKYVFLQTSEKYAWNLGGCNDIKPFHKKETLLLNYNSDFDYLNSFGNEIILKKFDNKHHQISDYSNKEYNGKIEIKPNETMLKHRMFYAEIELDRFEIEASNNLSPIMVISITDSMNANIFYYSFPINEIPNSFKNEWKTIKYSIEIPKITNVKDNLQFYIWNKHFQKFYIDNFKLKLTGID